MTLAPGTTVGRYQILEPLGQGGMATVYKAFQPSLQREVALKVLRPGYAQDQEFRERFEREAKSIARLRHPNIVQVFDFEVSTSGEFVLAMEFLDGGTLKDRMVQLAAASRALDPTETVRILWEVADALSYAHEQGIVHRDVKPSNVMLAKPRERAVVTDFGIARILGATSHTQTGVGIGTPEYMAPEQGQGTAIDHRADIYSLGAMAYELLVGRVPYTADTPLAVVIAHIKDPLPLPSKVNPTIGQGVERALLRALAKDPAQRYDSAIAFAGALRDGLAEDTKGGTVPTIVVRGGAAAASIPRRAPSAPNQVRLSLPPVLAQRPPVLVAAALVLATLAGTVLASGALRTATVASPQASPIAPQSPPSSAVPARGALIWQAKLDGTGTDLRRQSEFGGAGVSAVRTVPGAIELSVGPGAVARGVNVTLNMPARSTYVAELDLAFDKDADEVLWFMIRQNGTSDPSYRLRIASDGAMSAVYCPGQGQACDPQVVTSAAGSPFTVAIVVRTETFAVYVNGVGPLMEFSDRRLSGASVPQLQAYAPGAQRGGTVRVHGIRVYEPSSANVPTTGTAAAHAVVLSPKG